MPYEDTANNLINAGSESIYAFAMVLAGVFAILLGTILLMIFRSYIKMQDRQLVIQTIQLEQNDLTRQRLDVMSKSLDDTAKIATETNGNLKGFILDVIARLTILEEHMSKTTKELDNLRDELSRIRQQTLDNTIVSLTNLVDGFLDSIRSLVKEIETVKEPTNAQEFPKDPPDGADDPTRPSAITLSSGTDPKP